LTRPFAVSKTHTNGRVLILNDLFMKKLNLEQMEKIEGGLTRADWGCAVVGLTMGIINPWLGFGFGLWCTHAYS
jgi:hypothetical protein